MTEAGLGLEALRRNPLRVTLAVLSTFLALLVSTVLFNLVAVAGNEAAPGDDRYMVTNSLGLMQTLPERYGDTIAKLAPDRHISRVVVTPARTGVERRVLPLLAVDLEAWLTGYPELKLSPQARDIMAREPAGLLLGAPLARGLGVKAGDTLTVETPGLLRLDGGSLWSFKVAGTFEDGSSGSGASYGLFHFRRLDEGRAFGGGSVQYFLLSAAKSDDGHPPSQAIDAYFRNAVVSTRTDAEGAFAAALVAQFGDLRLLVTVVIASSVLSVLFVTGGILTMSVSERLREIAVLRAIGFQRRRIASIVAIEAFVLLMAPALLACLAANGVLATLSRMGIVGQIDPSRLLVVDALTLLTAAIAAVAASAIPIMRACNAPIQRAFLRE